MLPVDVVLAQGGQSSLQWSFHALGLFYAAVLPLTGLLVFVGACLVVALARRPAVVAAYLVLVPLPLLIGIYGSVQGMIASTMVIADSLAEVRLSDLAEGISTALFTTQVGFWATFPAYLVTSIGLLVRAATAKRNPP